MTMLTMRLPDEISQRLDRLVLKTGYTKTFYICEALKQYLEDREDIYLAEAALKRYKRRKYKTITHKELGAELGCLDD